MKTGGLNWDINTHRSHSIQTTLVNFKAPSTLGWSDWVIDTSHTNNIATQLSLFFVEGEEKEVAHPIDGRCCQPIALGIAHMVHRRDAMDVAVQAFANTSAKPHRNGSSLQTPSLGRRRRSKKRPMLSATPPRCRCCTLYTAAANIITITTLVCAQRSRCRPYHHGITDPLPHQADQT